MKQDAFLLAKDPEDDCRDVIFHRGGTLRLKVYCLNDFEFDPDPEELQFYSEHQEKVLAFETDNYDMEDPGLIIEAIKWYAKYVGNPEMEILPEDPRINEN